MMLIGLVAGAVVGTFVTLSIAWAAAAIALIPYTVLSFVFVKMTRKQDAFVNILRSLVFVATPTLVWLVVFFLIGGAPQAIPLFLVTGVFVLYPGAGMGGFLVTEMMVRAQEDQAS